MSLLGIHKGYYLETESTVYNLKPVGWAPTLVNNNNM